MATATAIQFRTSTPSNQSISTDQIRMRALARLYERRAAVDELIGSLERYQEGLHGQRDNCIAINAVAK